MKKNNKKKLLILVPLVAVLSSCGVPLSSQPNPIPLKQIPYGLATESKANVPTPKTPVGKKGPTGLTFYVYFVDNALLTPVSRTAPVPTPQLALRDLTLGPTFTEQETGITTALQLDPQPKLSLHVSKGPNSIATVSLDTTTASSPAIYLYQELGQIVWTLTQFCNITGVKFVYGGTPFPAYLPNGTDPTDPVNRIDYLEIVPTQLAANIKHFSCIGPIHSVTTTNNKK